MSRVLSCQVGISARHKIKETYFKGNCGVSSDLDKLAVLLQANHSASQ